MNTVYFPVEVVILLRRLANVLSTLSLSNHWQYILLRKARTEDDGTKHIPADNEEECRPSFWSLVQALRWPQWALILRSNWHWSKSTSRIAREDTTNLAGELYSLPLDPFVTK